MFRSQSLLLILAFVGLVSAPAVAADKVLARAAFRSAIKHYNLGEYREALDGFKEAYRNYEDPSFLFNLAQCERQLGEKREAINFYRSYLRELPEASNREEVRALIAKLTAQLQAVSPHAPPIGVTERVKQEPPVAAVVDTRSAPAPARVPLYQKWWLWTAVGTAAALGIGLGVGLGLSQSGSTPTATTSEGTFHPF